MALADIICLASYRRKRVRDRAADKIDVLYDRHGNIFAGCYHPGSSAGDIRLPWQLQLSIADARELGIRLLRAVEDAEAHLEREQSDL